MAKRKSRNFIQKAIKRPGALKRKAKAAGMSTQAFAKKEKGAPGKTGQEARFDLNVLRKVGRHKKRGAKRSMKRGMKRSKRY